MVCCCAVLYGDGGGVRVLVVGRQVAPCYKHATMFHKGAVGSIAKLQEIIECWH